MGAIRLTYAFESIPCPRHHISSPPAPPRRSRRPRPPALLRVGMSGSVSPSIPPKPPSIPFNPETLTREPLVVGCALGRVAQRVPGLLDQEKSGRPAIVPIVDCRGRRHLVSVLWWAWVEPVSLGLPCGAAARVGARPKQDVNPTRLQRTCVCCACPCCGCRSGWCCLAARRYACRMSARGAAGVTPSAS